MPSGADMASSSSRNRSTVALRFASVDRCRVDQLVRRLGGQPADARRSSRMTCWRWLARSSSPRWLDPLDLALGLGPHLLDDALTVGAGRVADLRRLGPRLGERLAVLLLRGGQPLAAFFASSTCLATVSCWFFIIVRTGGTTYRQITSTTTMKREQLANPLTHQRFLPLATATFSPTIRPARARDSSATCGSRSLTTWVALRGQLLVALAAQPGHLGARLPAQLVEHPLPVGPRGVPDRAGLGPRLGQRLPVPLLGRRELLARPCGSRRPAAGPSRCVRARPGGSAAR